MKKNLLFMLILIVLSSASVSAQVRIGDSSEPTKGAVLDLNATTYKGGLLLPQVNLTTLTALSDLTVTPDEQGDLKGLLVYNINITTGVGIYVWNGSKWEAIWKKI
jgi:hypothetical protein